MNPVIRRATEADAAAIASVQVAAWQWAYRGQMPDAYLDGLSVADIEAQWRTASIEVARYATHVAELGGNVVGFVSVGLPRVELHGDAPDPDLAADTSTAELYSIYLLQEYLGLGIGQALMRTGEQAMRDIGAGKAILWVLESNVATHRFYESCGWSPDGGTAIHELGGEQLAVVRFTKRL